MALALPEEATALNFLESLRGSVNPPLSLKNSPLLTRERGVSN